MSLIKWNDSPFEAMERVFVNSIDDLDRKLNRRLVKLGLPGEAFVPNIDIAEDSENFYIISELPGLGDDDVRVTIESNMLTISGEKQRTEELNKRNYHRVESSFGQFARSMALPTNVRSDEIRGVFHHGLLEITMPKTQDPRQTVREIPISKSAEPRNILSRQAPKAENASREAH